jgi:hypothetical protein
MTLNGIINGIALSLPLWGIILSIVHLVHQLFS